jgi:hypothetical protein
MPEGNSGRLHPFRVSKVGLWICHCFLTFNMCPEKVILQMRVLHYISFVGLHPTPCFTAFASLGSGRLLVLMVKGYG